jgi:hypothetical protein
VVQLLEQLLAVPMLALPLAFGDQVIIGSNQCERRMARGGIQRQQVSPAAHLLLWMLVHAASASTKRS